MSRIGEVVERWAVMYDIRGSIPGALRMKQPMAVKSSDPYATPFSQSGDPQGPKSWNLTDGNLSGGSPLAEG
jgi:hypothetical protein